MHWRLCISPSVRPERKNFAICLALSPIFGLVNHAIRLGEMERKAFTEFLNDTSDNFDEHDQQSLNFDGAPALRRQEQPRENIHLWVQPPYLPFLNIVEQAISCLKASVKRTLHVWQNKVQQGNAQQPLGEYRKQLLVEAIERRIGSVTVQKWAAWS